MAVDNLGVILEKIEIEVSIFDVLILTIFSN